ncbi:MAG TPA: Gfo/Idh/MocA family oxidoreductase [Elusimicrobiales bacterium]|nr:Gfo/Idh/MocA family oxidoreductase [Elusimicrobiales bacterium]
MVNVGVIGYGYWGPNLVRNFSRVPGATLSKIADLYPKRRDLAQKLYPQVRMVAEAGEVINDPLIDCVVLATPILTHYQLAKKALLAGKHVLVEKSLTASYKEAQELQELAQKKKLVLMVDHTFLYSSAVHRIKKMVDSGELGRIQYLDSTRINLGKIKNDISVIWDLMAHDAAITAYLVGEKPISVNATGISHTRYQADNIAYLTLKYRSGLIAHFTSSWISPVKVRTMLIGGDKKMIVYDDVEPTEKIKVYDSGYVIHDSEEKDKVMVQYRTGDIYVPSIDPTEALFTMAQDFVGSIVKGKQPVSCGKMGVEVVRVLEAAIKSARSGGKEIPLK